MVKIVHTKEIFKILIPDLLLAKHFGRIVLISFHPEIQISGWKHLDFRTKLCQKPFFKGVLAIDGGRYRSVLIRKGLFRMRTI